MSLYYCDLPHLKKEYTSDCSGRPWTVVWTSYAATLTLKSALYPFTKLSRLSKDRTALWWWTEASIEMMGRSQTYRSALPTGAYLLITSQ